MKDSGKRVCVFGIYDRAYPHNTMLMRGLIENGYEIVECHADPQKFPGWKKYRELMRVARMPKALAQTSTSKPTQSDLSFVLVLSPGHTVVWLARLLFPGKRIVFDAFVSLYDSNVCDRKLYSRMSVRGVRDWVLDWSSTALASFVILDTHAHIEYFVRTFGVSRKKCIRVFVSTDAHALRAQAVSESAIFLSNPPEPFIVHFHGTYIPLQGIPHILDAARLFLGEGSINGEKSDAGVKTEIIFRIIGGSSNSRYVRELRASARDLVEAGVVEFIDAVPLASLAGYMHRAHLCLGIFGDTEKAQRVIPNKVYEALALGKPLITADTPAARELLSEENAVLVQAGAQGMAAALAQEIRRLMAHPEECARLSRGATELFATRLQPKQLVAEMLTALNIATITETSAH